MAQPHPLDRVVKKVAWGVTPEDDAERIVIIDVKKKRAVPRRGMLGDYRYYRVANAKDPRNEARVELASIPLDDPDHRVDVAVSLHLSCPPDNEERVAEALFDASLFPAEVLERHVGRLLLDLRREGGVAALVRRHFAEPDELRETVAEKLFEATGLRAAVKLSLPRQEQLLKTVRVDVPSVTLLVRDYDREQELGVRVDLEVDDGNRAAAVLRAAGEPELQQVVTREVRRYVRANVTLTELATGLGAGPAREGLIRHLDAVLAPFGRRVGALVLSAQAPADLRPSHQAEVNVRCRIHEFPEEVVITSKVLLNLQDLARYREAGSPPLEAWLRERLEGVIRQRLFDARYIDLLIRFAPLEQLVKEDLKVAAAAIGYEIRQLVTLPDLPPIRWRDPFTLEPVGAFETRLRNVQVKLQVVVTARIPNLEAIESLLNGRQDVPARMTEAILAVIRDRLHAIDPERFYMRFSFNDPTDPEETRSVEAELTELVHQTLAARFHAEVMNVVIKVVDTELIERFRRLQERICDFEVAVGSLEGGEDVVFRGAFRVMRVHPHHWHEFQLLNLGLEEIRDQLQTHLLALLQTQVTDALRFRNPEHRSELERFVTRAAGAFVVKNFGLEIALLNLRRERTRIESSLSARQADDDMAVLAIGGDRLRRLLEAQGTLYEGRVAEIERLVEARAQLAAAEGSDAEVAELDRKIEQRMKSLGEDDLRPVDQLRLALLGSSSATLALPAVDPEHDPVEDAGAPAARP